MHEGTSRTKAGVMNSEELAAAVLAEEPTYGLKKSLALTTIISMHVSTWIRSWICSKHTTSLFPLFPGALQCEAAFQASAALIARTQPTRPGYLPVVARVRSVKFRRLVRREKRSTWSSSGVKRSGQPFASAAGSPSTGRPRPNWSLSRPKPRCRAERVVAGPKRCDVYLGKDAEGTKLLVRALSRLVGPAGT